MFNSTDIEMYSSSQEGKVTLAVKDHRLANRINKVLGSYEDRAKPGDEATFRLYPSQIPSLYSALGKVGGLFLTSFLEGKPALSYDFNRDGSTT